MKQSIRLVLLDHHELVREGLRTILHDAPGMVVVGEAGTYTDVLPLIRQQRPNLVVLDLQLPDVSGLEACRQLLVKRPKLRLLVLTSCTEPATVLRTIQSGAHGYVLKNVRPDELIRAIRTVAEGQNYLNSEMTEQIFKRFCTKGDLDKQSVKDLTPQELRILPLLAQGLTNKEIAQQLQLSDKTVNNYLANIYDKFGVKRRAEAVVRFLKEQPPSFTPEVSSPSGSC